MDLNVIEAESDIHLEGQRVPYEKNTAMERGETSANIRSRIEVARDRQQERFAIQDKPDLLANGDMGPAKVQEYCELYETGGMLMSAAVKQMDLSARACHRVLKLARTIADLVNEPAILPHHLAEALQYRPRGIN